MAAVNAKVLWIISPSGPYEPYFAATALLFLATEGFRRYAGKLFRMEGLERTTSERVRHHESLRERFKEEIARCRDQSLRKDVIIRHVNRMDDYPNVNPGPGISPWFTVGLLDTYTMGIVVGLGWEGLIHEPNGWRKPNYKAGERGNVTSMLAARIPYDFVDSMNVEGDEYYGLPHIFCHFAHRGEPYERLHYSEKVDMGHGHDYWKAILSYEEVAHSPR